MKSETVYKISLGLGILGLGFSGEHMRTGDVGPNGLMFFVASLSGVLFGFGGCGLLEKNKK